MVLEIPSDFVVSIASANGLAEASTVKSLIQDAP